MKLGDLTLNQIAEICKNHLRCKGCPVAMTVDVDHTCYTVGCMVCNMFPPHPPHKWDEGTLNQEVVGIDTRENTRCADCTRAETYGERVVCKRAPGAEFTINDFCSRWKKR